LTTVLNLVKPGKWFSGHKKEIEREKKGSEKGGKKGGKNTTQE